jgi:hypothetical protein
MLIRRAHTSGRPNHDDYDLHWLLADPGELEQIPGETGCLIHNGIAVYPSSPDREWDEDEHPGRRYVHYADGRPLAALRVTQYPATRRRPARSVVVWIWTEEDQRGKGLATALFARAKDDYPNLSVGSDRSPAGAGWVTRLEDLGLVPRTTW